MRLEVAFVRQAARERLRAARERPRLHLAIVALLQPGLLLLLLVLGPRVGQPQPGLLLLLPVLGPRVGQPQLGLLLLPVRELRLEVFLGRLYKRRNSRVASYHWGYPNWACSLPLRVSVIHRTILGYGQ